jgi:predicted enzyme related to lactoylglutathione lyase
MNGEVVHFELPAKDFSRAKAFYSKVFGWKTFDASTPSGAPYASLVTTKTDGSSFMEVANTRPKSRGAINGGMMKQHKPFTAPVINILVEDVASALKAIEKQGGKIIVKRTRMGRYGAYAYFRDTEGNLMGLVELSPRKM